MSQGFSRFGKLSARERFHAQAKSRGSLAMFLPTILATLFLFTAVIALNKITSLSNGKTIRLINVDDVFPDPAAVEQHTSKEYWEATPPRAPVAAPDASPADTAFRPAPRLSDGGGVIDPPQEAASSVALPAATPALDSINPDIRMPDVKPDTSLPGAVTP